MTADITVYVSVKSVLIFSRFMTAVPDLLPIYDKIQHFFVPDLWPLFPNTD